MPYSIISAIVILRFSKFEPARTATPHQVLRVEGEAEMGPGLAAEDLVIHNSEFRIIETHRLNPLALKAKKSTSALLAAVVSVPI